MRKFLGFLCLVGLAAVVLHMIPRVFAYPGTSEPAAELASAAYEPVNAAPPRPAFTVQIAGNTYTGASASHVGVAVVGFGYLPVASMSSRSFLQVEVAVTNMQRDAITMTFALFRLIGPNGEEYSPDTDVQVNDVNNEFFLTQINPGITRAGGIIFQVPSGIKPSDMRLQFRGGMTGQTESLPLEVVVEQIPKPAPAQPESLPSPVDHEEEPVVASNPDPAPVPVPAPAPAVAPVQKPTPPVDFVVDDLPQKPN